MHRPSLVEAIGWHGNCGMFDVYKGRPETSELAHSLCLSITHTNSGGQGREQNAPLIVLRGQITISGTTESYLALKGFEGVTKGGCQDF